MNASELKYHVEMSGKEPHFFSRANMRFSGDTMANYGVRSATILTNWDDKDKWSEQPISREVWELYRKRPVKHGLQGSVYFNKNDFSREFPASE